MLIYIAITDERGNLIAFERMDGGKVTSTAIAIDKSFTASSAKKATHQYGAISQPGGPAFGTNSAIGCRLMIVGSDLPVIADGDGDCVGGIGISSGPPAQDQACTRVGNETFIAT